MAFSWYRSVTIDKTKVPSNQTDFPVLVSGVYSYLATIANGGLVTNANGYDIGFYADAGLTTKLKWETERYIATTGEVVYWVKVPTVSSSVDTVIYIAYTNPSITTDQSDKTNVWDSNYLGVYHLPDGTTLGALDSTANARNGTLTNTPTAAAGQIDGAGSFAAASSQYIALGAGINPTAITMSCWVKGTSFATYSSPMNRVSGLGFSQIFVKSTGKLAMYVRAVSGDVSYDGSGANTLSTGTWYYIVLTYNSSAGLAGYFNGSSDSTASPNGLLKDATAETNDIGRDGATGGRYWNGQIDEVRWSGIARSANWITAEYNNQSSPSTFYALGTQTAFVANAESFAAASEAAASFTTAPSSSIAAPSSASAVFTESVEIDLDFDADAEADALVDTEFGTSVSFSAAAEADVMMHSSYSVPQLGTGLRIIITDQGSGYTTPPVVTITGIPDAEGIAVLDADGHVVAVVVTCRGDAPSGTPGVTIGAPSPGPGDTATADIVSTNPTSSQHSKQIPFVVRKDGYGNVCIETNFLEVPAPESFGALQPPPLPQPVLESSGDVESDKDRDPTSRLMARAWAVWFDQVQRALRFALGGRPSSAFEVLCPSVDETDSEWYALGAMPGAATDPVTIDVEFVNQSRFMMTAEVIAGGSGYVTVPDLEISGANGTGKGASGTVYVLGQAVVAVTIEFSGYGYQEPLSFSLIGGGGTGALIAGKVGRQFNKGDYILWNDPTNVSGERSYEIDLITALTPLTNETARLTLQRRPSGGSAGRAQFDSPMRLHPECEIYRLVNKVFPITPGVGPQIHKFLWADMMVAAAKGSILGFDATTINLVEPVYLPGTTTDADQQRPPCPGLRTLNGAAYTNIGILGDLAIGQTAIARISVQDWESIRCVYAKVAVAPVGSPVRLQVCYITRGTSPQVGLIDTLEITEGFRESFLWSNEPDGRMMPYHADFPLDGARKDWPTNRLPLINDALDVDGNLIEGVVDPEETVLFQPDGQIDILILGVGDPGTTGSDLVVTVQS